jgi:hypothetical protein
MTAMIDETTVAMLQRHWEDGWNAYDLEMIMAPVGEEVVFSSPAVTRATGDPSGTIHGYAALRSYCEAALRRTPGIRYRLDATYVGTDSVILAYSFDHPDGKTRTGSDSMRVNEDNKIIEWRCHYVSLP